MAQQNDKDLYLLLGKIDGKIDALTHQNKDLVTRIERVEERAMRDRAELGRIKATLAKYSVYVGLGATALSALVVQLINIGLK